MSKRKYCNSGCRTSYHEDRQQGLIYGGYAIRQDQLPAHVPSTPLGNGLVVVSWAVGCIVNRECLYCRADLS